jgi:RHS repeat-associated protein
MAAEVLPQGGGNEGQTNCNGSGVIAPAQNASQAWTYSDGETASFFTGGTNVLTALSNSNSIPIDVIDGQGNTYHFESPTVPVPGEGSQWSSGTGIEDRNGNGFAVGGTDTAGRPLATLQVTPAMVTSPNPSQITVFGLTYTVQTETTTVNYTLPADFNSHTPIEDVAYCPTASDLPPNSSTITVISSISVPSTNGNTLTYTFHYDPTYGTIDEIDYPDGGKVTYTWGLPGSFSQSSSFTGLTLAKAQIPNGCYYVYETPVVLERKVYYDGSTLAQDQTFSYTTTWSDPGQPLTTWATKSTTVSTDDDVLGLTASVVYNYVPVGQLTPAFSNGCGGSCNSPVEESVQTFDWGVSPGGTPLETVYKAWGNQFQLACEVHVPNGNANLAYGHFYQYEYGLQTDDKGYDVGQLGSSPQTACSPSSMGAPSTTPLRETKTTALQQFVSPVNGLSFYKPTTVQVLSNGTMIAETLYSYDGAGSIAPLNLSSLTNHDETNFPQTVTANRGNLTSVTKVCLVPGTGCTGNSVTTYVYDETGQLYSMTEPCSNGSCGDVLSGSTFTTTFSHLDSYSSGGPPSGEQSDTYLTKITYPLTKTNHVESFKYNWQFGDLTSATDENNNTTTYSYNIQGPGCGTQDKLDRLDEIQYPDGGITSHCYNDGTYSASNNIPNITTNELLTSTYKTTVSAMDGMGRVVHTNLTSDPYGADYVDTAYDGESRVHTKSNPYRSVSDPSYGVTTFYYDALGQTVAQVQPDNSGTDSILSICHNYVPSTNQPPSFSPPCHSWSGSVSQGLWVDATDELGNDWQKTSDAFGNLTEVREPNGTSPLPSMETDYTYDALNNLLSVNQVGDGSGTRVRRFVYDSLSQLAASLNSEDASAANPPSLNCANGICYTAIYAYDLNGNLTTKTDNRIITGTTHNAISYTYDALNRVTQKVYNDGVTPTEGYGYDGYDQNQAKINTPSLTNVNGRLSRSINESFSAGSDYSYDPMGRTKLKASCIPGDCSYTDVEVNATYDAAGDLTSLTNGSTNQPITFTYSYDNAARVSQLISNWNPDCYHPATLFQANSASPAAYGPVGLMNSVLGVTASNCQGAGQNFNQLTQTRNYDNRLRVTNEAYSATNINTASATQSTGTITIAGSEQSTQINQGSGSGSVSISGTERSTTIQVSCGPDGQTCPQTIYDSGTLTVTVNGTPFTTGYGQSTTASSLASTLAQAMNGSLVTATASGSTVTITAKATGTSSDYSLSASSTTTNTQYFSGSSFTPTPSGSTLTGGNNGTTNYDTGTITATVNGKQGTANWSQSSTPSSLASALAASLQTAAGSFLTATASGSSVTLTSTSTGTSTNWPISVTVDNTDSNFTSPSFSDSYSGMSGGVNAGFAPETAYSYTITPSGGSSGYDYAGNVKSATDSVIGSWTYNYDTLNRVVNGTSTTTPYAGDVDCWTYDGFGNRTSESIPPNSTPCNNNPTKATWATYNTYNQTTETNFLPGSGNQYDASGDVIYDGVNTYLYDGAGRNCAVKTPAGTMYQYIYDAEGSRVARGTISTFNCNVSTNGFTLQTQWVVGLSNEQLSELKANNQWTHTNLFTPGGLTVTYHDTNTYFDLTDWVGTKRAEASAGGCLSAWSSFPFGSDLQPVSTGATGCQDATEHHYTTKERDTESGNDYFLARYYTSSMGRFLQPDWSAKTEPVPYAKVDDPQSLNLYQYALNRPLTLFDTDGHDLTVATELQPTVNALRQQSPSFNAELSAHEGPGSPNLTIKFGPTPNDPGGQATTGNTSATISVVGLEPLTSSDQSDEDAVEYGGYKGATVTINSSISSDSDAVDKTVAHEVGHVHDARTNTDQYGKDSEHTKATHGKQDHDSRPEEKRANQFKDRVIRERKEFKEEQKHEKKQDQ